MTEKATEMGHRIELEEIGNQRHLDKSAAESLRMDKKALYRDFERRLQMENVEEEIEAKIKQKDESFLGKDDFEIRLNEEMMRLKTEEQNEVNKCLILCKNSPELKELKQKIQNRYTAKKLMAQINEKKKSSDEEKLYLRQFEEFMNSKLELAKRLEQKQLEEDNTKKLRYKEDLLNQIAQSSKKEDAFKELWKDKTMLELNTQSLKEQTEREKEICVNKLKKLKDDIQQEKRLQHQHKEQNKLARDYEERNIKEYNIKQEIKEKQALEKNKYVEKLKKQHQEQLYDNFNTFFENRHEKEEREEILYCLQEKKLNESYIKREKEDMERSCKLREELKKAAEKHHKEKMRTIEENKLQELKYRKQLEAEAAKDRQLAQIKLENKRQSTVEYKNRLKEQIEEKHRQQVECWQKETVLQKQREEEETQNKNLVNEECLKMLKKHISDFI